MLAAIPGGPRQLARASKPVPTGEAKAQDTAERRQVTVMFSDLVGSTASRRAWTLRTCARSFLSIRSASPGLFSASAVRCEYMGDGVLVYFGYPQAHEDDAERAVRAGLELIQAVDALKTASLTSNPRGHCHRVGGRRRPDRIGSRSGAAIVGETPNLAARLQGTAEPNTVVIAESTRKLLGNLFDFAGPRGEGP